MTQEQCERAVKALQEAGFQASYVQGAPDDHGVWLDNVWDKGLENSMSVRLHDEEIEYWSSVSIPDEGVAFQDYTPKNT